MSAAGPRAPTARRRLLRWANGFAAANAVLLIAVGLGYLWHYSAVGSVAWAYAVLAYLGHLAVLAWVPLAVLLVPAAVLIARPRVVLPLGVVVSAAGLSLVVLDSLVFAENRYHLSVVTFTLLEPQTFVFLGVYFVAGLAIEGMLAARIWARTAVAPGRRIVLPLALGLGACFAVSQVVYAWAEAHYYVPVTAFTRYLPLFFPLNARQTQLRFGLLDRARAHEQALVRALDRPPAGVLSYPLAPLTCAPRPPLPNVLLVVIDAMRADALTPAVAPRLSAFARDAIRFDHHYSGGNSSRAGLFSLFYGLPPTYWDAFADVTQPPVMMELFRQHGYQLGPFVSSAVYKAVGLDRTAFARVPDLRFRTYSPYPGAGHGGKDRQMTEEWLAWLAARDPSRPFWGMLYFNAAVAIEPPSDYPIVVPVAPGAPEQERRRALYLTAVHYIDSLFGRAIDDLDRRGLLDRTVVVVTSDHGMEFDERGLGFAGHGTAYSDYQMHTPLLIRWPGRPPGRVARRTSHYDVAPTFVTELFGCTNPPSDYASGSSLFSDAEWRWLVAASYSDFAVIEPDRVTVVLPAGFEIRDPEYRLVQDPALPRGALRAAMREMSRFYR